MDPLNPAFRGVLVTALVLLIGVPPTLSFVVFPELERRDLDTARSHRVALAVIGASLIGAALAGTVLAVGNAQSSEVATFADWVGSTAAGQAWAALSIIAFGLGGVTAGRYLLPNRVSRRVWLGVVFLGTLAMLVAFCWTRYSTAVESPAIAILMKFGHMAGGALWVGGLAILALLPLLMPRNPDTNVAELVLSIVRRFSIIAVAGVTIAFATGVVIAAWHVPAVTALATTPYGILLSAKVGLVMIGAGIGGFNRVVLHERISYSMKGSNDTAALPGMLMAVSPRIPESSAVSAVTRAIRLELAVLAAAVGLSVALTTSVTPSYELLEPAVAVSSGVFVDVDIGEFASLLKLGAVGIALIGSLALGYEVGKFDVSRKSPASKTTQQSHDEPHLSRD